MLPRRKRPAHALICALALALGLAPAAGSAQSPTVEIAGKALATTLAGHRISFPLPPWIDEASPSETPFVIQQLERDVVAMLFVPPGQTIISWTQMSGLLVVSRPGYSAAAQIASVVRPMSASCASGQMKLTPVQAVRQGELEAVILVCGRYKPTGDAPNGCAAGIVVAVARQSASGAMKAYDEWCTGAFDVATPAGWPVSPDRLLAIATGMQVATAFDILPVQP
jgi:hypothetical protein